MTPSDPSHKLHKQYFVPDSRGYLFISNFYAKYYRELSATEFESFDAFLNQIFLNLSKIDFSTIDGPEEHYVIKAMYYQCWNIIYRLKRERMFMVPDSAASVLTDDGAGESLIDREASDDPGPLEHTEVNDLFAIINTFKITLKRNDLLILNALIEQRSLEEIAGIMRFDYNALCVKVKRLREKLAVYLKSSGYQNDRTRVFLRKNKKSL
jgi:hypothetical protein